jgi:hypothetical protein
LGSLGALAERIADIQNQRSAAGRGPLTICSGIFGRVADHDLADALDDYAQVGVDWVRIVAPGTTMVASIQRLRELAAALGH